MIIIILGYFTNSFLFQTHIGWSDILLFLKYLPSLDCS